MVQTESIGKRAIEEAQNTNQFDLLCQQKCIIAFLDTNSDVDDELDVMMKVSLNKDFASYEYLWIDGNC